MKREDNFNFINAAKEQNLGSSYFWKHIVPQDYKLTKEDVDFLMSNTEGEDPDISPATIFCYLIERGQKDMISNELLWKPVTNENEEQANGMLNVITSEYTSKPSLGFQLVNDLLDTNPLALKQNEKDRNRGNIGIHINKDHAQAYVAAGGKDLNCLFGTAFITQEIVDKAVYNGLTNIWQIPSNFRNLELVIKIGSMKSFYNNKEYSDYGDCLEKDWGMTKKDLKGLLKDNQIPSWTKMKAKLDPEMLKRVQKAAHFHVLSEKVGHILSMPDEFKEMLSDGQVMRIARAGFMAALPESKITEEVVFVFQKNHTGSLEGIDQKYITREMAFESVKEKGRYIKYVPSDFINQELCEIAIEDDPRNIDYIPEEYREDFYRTVAKSGNLDQIPEDKRTDRICTMAVEANGEALKYVPEDKKNFGIILTAIDNSYKAYEFIPEGTEDDDHELKVRTLISFLKARDFWNAEMIKEMVKSVANYGYKREVISVEAMKRNPELFRQLVELANRDRTFNDAFMREDTCLIAFRGDKSNVSHMPQGILQDVFKNYVELKEEQKQ